MKPLTHISDKYYSSKIILLGEYAVIQGGEILATPLNQYSARWIKNIPSDYHTKGLQLVIDYLRSTNNCKVNLDEIAQAMIDGIYLQSDIPSGYGLGSSGAITAAIYDIFVGENVKATNIASLQQDLIDIESCFHGVSSGIDPLVIYLNQGVHINSKGISLLSESIDLSRYFLIDTLIPRKTSPLVEQYLERAKKESYLTAIEDYKSINSRAIQAQLTDNQKSLSAAISEISHWQYKNLEFAILDDYRDLWKSTLDQEYLSIKLCGAGGGGFLLGYAHDMDRAMSELADYNLIRL